MGVEIFAFFGRGPDIWSRPEEGASRADIPWMGTWRSGRLCVCEHSVSFRVLFVHSASMCVGWVGLDSVCGVMTSPLTWLLRRVVFGGETSLLSTWHGHGG